MKIAIPVANGVLNLHFGHCSSFVIAEVDCEQKKLIKKLEVPAPKHEPGVLPRFLAQQGVDLIISGGMGMSAQNLFKEAGVDVIVGAPSVAVDQIIEDYLQGTLVTGHNECGH
ncbi:MAG: NifB/NifX family molybdenum-iron cluster-binding protein [Sphaerochaetaceae bacterium]|jgi:predicted Fe-Mo cluster-binding NifX family protein